MIEEMTRQIKAEMHERLMTRADDIARQRREGDMEETTVYSYGAECYAMGYEYGLDRAFEYAFRHRDSLSYEDFKNALR